MNIPIVTLDKIYITPDNKNIYFLDCTRVTNTNKIISRKEESLEGQIKRIGNLFKEKEILLADDVVFSGSVLKKIIEMFNKYNVKVVGIISSISTIEGYNYFNNNLKYGLRTNYIMQEDVIDQICERDFYFGIAGSGTMIETNIGLFKAPYFRPYGNPNERASIPLEFEEIFSKGCLERSVYLWENIDKGKGKKTLISDLPEKVINTKNEDEIVKVLKKEIKRI